MNFKFWTWGKKKKPGEPEVTNVRTINDIQIHVATGLHGTKNVTTSGWNPEMTQALFWSVWDGLVEREGK